MRDGTVSTINTWRLDSPAQTLVFASFAGRLPVCVHWGAPLPQAEDLAALAAAWPAPKTPAMLDAPAEPSLCPEAGWAFPGAPGLVGHRQDGVDGLTQFSLDKAAIDETGLRVAASDPPRGLALEMEIALDPQTEIVTAKSRLTNTGDAPYWLNWLTAPVLPLHGHARTITDFAGRWTNELQPEALTITQGQHVRENRRGRTGHHHFPAFVIPLPGCVESAGEAYAVQLAWSGNHRMLAERQPNGRGQLQAGSLLEPGEMRLMPGDSFETPDIAATYSANGLNGILHAFHRHARKIIGYADPGRPRPVHFNCWEAVYFDHSVATLKDLADRAAALGVERFVLDDGWFKGRDDDTRALGDWVVDIDKFPDRLDPLIEHIHDLGMTFGLWVEPEMISPDSDLARAHPEWIIQPEGFTHILGRNQQVLDLTNSSVFEHLFDRIGALLADHAIEYLKWDMNRDLALAIDLFGKPLVHRQTLALYALIDRIRDAFPHVEIESCASGGARIDLGILKRTHRVWLSDSNDARSRARMQHEAFRFLPPEVVGSHVGPRVCHTSGRVLPMGFRAGVALTGQMGVEADIREFDAEETRRLVEAIALYKDNRDWMHRGRLHRLETADDHHLAHMVVDTSGGRFMLFLAVLDVEAKTAAAPLRLAGLAPNDRYTLRLRNAEDIDPVACRDYVSPLADASGLSLTGATLMSAGIILPNALPDTMWIVTGEKTE